MRDRHQCWEMAGRDLHRYCRRMAAGENEFAVGRIGLWIVWSKARHHGRSISLTRAMLSSSYKMEPEISCSEDMRVSKWSRMCCARQFRSGTMNENFISCQLVDAP